MTDDSDSPSDELIERLLRTAATIRKFPHIPTNAEPDARLMEQAAARIQELEEALSEIAAPKYGLQAIHEDYDAGPARDAAEAAYWQGLAESYQRRARSRRE